MIKVQALPVCCRPAYPACWVVCKPHCPRVPYPYANTGGVFQGERVRQEVPLLGSNLQSQQDQKALHAAGVKQEVPPRNSHAEQAISLGHTCVADRTVFGAPPGQTTGLGLVAW